MANKRVAFRSLANGRLLCVDPLIPGVTRNLVVANRTEVGGWEQFEEIVLNPGVDELKLDQIEGAFGYHDTIKWAAPGDRAALERIFGFPVDNGDWSNWTNNRWTWRQLINRMLARS